MTRSMRPHSSASTPGSCAVTQERSPKIEFHKMREHAGLIFHAELGAAA